MTRWLVVAAAAAVPAVPAVRLLRTFAASPLPKPNPLPTEIAVPSASPPEDMDLIAVPTGVNKRVAAYGYRGGSFFDKRDFMPDFPGVPVLVSKRDEVAFNKPGMRGYFGPPFNQFHFNWHEFDFERMSNRILTGFVVPQSDCLVHRSTAASRRPVGELQRV